MKYSCSAIVLNRLVLPSLPPTYFMNTLGILCILPGGSQLLIN